MERSGDWWDQAQGDLEHARNDLAGGFFDWACFSAHQAAEKALKAVFQRRGDEAWGHSVADLLDALGGGAAAPADLRDRALELDKSYIASRYPNAHPAGSPRRRYTRAEAERLIAHAEQILGFCQSLLAAI